MTPTAVGQYSILLPGMPGGKVILTQGLTTMRTLAPRQGSEQGEVERPGHKESGESQGHVSLPTPKWDVDRFLKKWGQSVVVWRHRPGGNFGKATLVRFDGTELVLKQMGCPFDLWVRFSIEAIRG